MQVDEQRVVVEHLLEVRHEPALVDRVAREAAAEVIVDAALADVGERGVDGVPRRLVAVADGAAPQQPEEAPLRELRRAREAAVRAGRRRRPCGAVRSASTAIVDVGRAVAGGCALASAPRPAGRRCGRPCRAPRGRCGRPRAARAAKPGRPIARRRREVGAAPERARLAVEEHGERPAALLAQRSAARACRWRRCRGAPRGRP